MRANRGLTALVLLFGLTNMSFAADPLAMVPLRDTFPTGSINTLERADDALTAVAARKTLVESEYIDAERACYKRFFANDCIDELKARRRLVDADIGAVQLEASRFKRTEKDKEARDKQAQKAADKAASAAQDAAQREQNRLGYQQKQVDVAKKLSNKASRSGQDASNAAAFSGKLKSGAENQRTRADKHVAADAKTTKAEADQKQKEADAEARRQSLKRHREEKAADRAKRADEAKANGKPPPPGTSLPATSANRSAGVSPSSGNSVAPPAASTGVAPVNTGGAPAGTAASVTSGSLAR